ncbi:MAG: hypothetical protein COB02_06150 [Candidatus Cloacimonadota bacterium]|nr:MAG: hypothetical protein COB02_06150 [Candidatus Cloacimonadota bacterium]
MPLDKQNNFSKKSKNFSLACYLLGNGSLSWMIFFALIPVLMNLGVIDTYTEMTELNYGHNYENKRISAVVTGTVYARMRGMESELTEVHYHYTFKDKNFSGFSYLSDKYIKAGEKVSIVVSESNPKLSRVITGSYSEVGLLAFLPLMLMFYCFFYGINRTLGTLSNTHVSEFKMLEDTYESIFSHFLVRRLSIILISITICYLMSITTLLFDYLLPGFFFLIVVLGLIYFIWLDCEEVKKNQSIALKLS